MIDGSESANKVHVMKVFAILPLLLRFSYGIKVFCGFNQTELRLDIGQNSSVELGCANPPIRKDKGGDPGLFDESETMDDDEIIFIVLSLHQQNVDAGNHFDLCNDIDKNSSRCTGDVEDWEEKIDMTKFDNWSNTHNNETMVVTSGKYGISCIKLMASNYYQDWFGRASDNDSIAEVLLVSEATLYSKKPKDEVIHGFTKLSIILTYVALACGNFLLGTGIDLENIIIGFRSTFYRIFVRKPTESLKTNQKRKPICQFSAWMLGLPITILLPPVLAYIIAITVFQGIDECIAEMNLSRIGLFLLGTAGSNSGAGFISALYSGDIQLSVLLMLTSNLLSLVTSTFWWETLGQYLLMEDATHNIDPRAHLLDLVEILILLLVPVIIGTLLAYKFPKFKIFMKKIRKPIILGGMLVAIVVYYFSFMNFKDVFRIKQFIACTLFALGCLIFSLVLCFSCWWRLEMKEITSIVIDACMRNGSVVLVIANVSLPEDPDAKYAIVFANAQLLFTTAPFVLFWALYTGTKMTLKYLGCTKVNIMEPESPVIDTDRGYECVQISKMNHAWTNEDHDMLRHLWI